MFPFTPHTTLRSDFCSGGSLLWGAKDQLTVISGEWLVKFWKAKQGAKGNYFKF